jgi:hypothetical protein
VEEEAIRDLVRAREDVRGDLMRWRQRLSKLLLRHGIVYQDTASTWTQRHRAWIRSQNLGGGAQVTLLDHLGAVDTLELRRGQLEKTIAELVPDSPYVHTVARLRCLRGIDTLSAAGLAAEIGDLRRFDRPGKLMRRPVSTPLGGFDRGHIPRSPPGDPLTQMARCANGKSESPPGGSAGARRHAPARPSAAVRLRQATATSTA